MAAMADDVGVGSGSLTDAMAEMADDDGGSQTSSSSGSSEDERPCYGSRLGQGEAAQGFFMSLSYGPEWLPDRGEELRRKRRMAVFPEWSQTPCGWGYDGGNLPKVWPWLDDKLEVPRPIEGERERGHPDVDADAVSVSVHQAIHAVKKHCTRLPLSERFEAVAQHEMGGEVTDSKSLIEPRNGTGTGPQTRQRQRMVKMKEVLFCAPRNKMRKQIEVSVITRAANDAKSERERGRLPQLTAEAKAAVKLTLEDKKQRVQLKLKELKLSEVAVDAAIAVAKRDRSPQPTEKSRKRRGDVKLTPGPADKKRRAPPALLKVKEEKKSNIAESNCQPPLMAKPKRQGAVKLTQAQGTNKQRVPPLLLKKEDKKWDFAVGASISQPKRDRPPQLTTTRKQQDDIKLRLGDKSKRASIAKPKRDRPPQLATTRKRPDDITLSLDKRASIAKPKRDRPPQLATTRKQLDDMKLRLGDKRKVPPLLPLFRQEKKKRKPVISRKAREKSEEGTPNPSSTTTAEAEAKLNMTQLFNTLAIKLGKNKEYTNLSIREGVPRHGVLKLMVAASDTSEGQGLPVQWCANGGLNCLTRGKDEYPCLRCRNVRYCCITHRSQHSAAHLKECKMDARLDAYSAQNNLHEDYKSWLKLSVPNNYDACLNFVLVCPSSTVQIFPDAETTRFGDQQADATCHKLLLATQAVDEPNHLMICDLVYPNNNRFAGHLRVVQRINHEGEVLQARLMPQSKDIIATSSYSRNIYVFKTSEFEEIPDNDEFHPSMCLQGERNGEGSGLSWGPSGNIAAGFSTGAILIWNITSGISLGKSRRHRILLHTQKHTAHSGLVLDVAWHPTSDNLLASCGEDKKLIVWDVRQCGKAFSARKAHDAEIRSVSISPYAEHVIATGGADRVVKIWDTRNHSRPRIQTETQGGEVSRVEWSTQNRDLLAVGCADNKVTVWNVCTAGLVANKSDATSLLASPQFIHSGHCAPVNDIAWNGSEANMNMIASVSQDNVLQVWQMKA